MNANKKLPKQAKAVCEANVSATIKASHLQKNRLNKECV